MSRRSKLTDEERISVVQKYQDRKSGYSAIEGDMEYQSIPSLLYKDSISKNNL